MDALAPEIRLGLALLVNGLMLLAAFRFARRFASSGLLQAACDAMTLYLLMQYAAVVVPGVVGLLSPIAMVATAMVSSALLLVASFARPSPAGGISIPLRSRLGFLAAALFAVGFVLRFAWIQRYFPPIVTDVLVYHLPTAAQWLGDGRLSLYPTWYWNPAATYSPASGETFPCWWLGLMGNDTLARFVQLPALALIFLVVARMCRLGGTGRVTSGLIAMATVLSRPFISEALSQKDDLYVAAFIATAVLSLARPVVGDRLGPWRVGVAIGLVLASKYTALLVCPIFLFLVDSPFLARWKARDFGIAVLLTCAIALPWYVRNIALTGNPLFPVNVNLGPIHLRGLFSVTHDRQLSTYAGIVNMLSATYHSLPPMLILVLVLLLCLAWLTGGARVLRDPLWRACTIGSLATLVIFLLASPHHEVRYLFPLMVLWFATAGMGLGNRKWAPLGAAVLAGVSIFTSFAPALIGSILELSAGGAIVALAGAAILWLDARFPRFVPRQRAIAVLAAVCVLAMAIYVQWQAYVETYQVLRLAAWERPDGYPRPAPLWRFINEQTQHDATIAYANTFFTYPFCGYELKRRVVYAPVRKNLHRFLDLPYIGDNIPGDELVARMTSTMNADPDPATWVENLRNLKVDYLVVLSGDPQNPDLSQHPPEMAFAEARFRVIYSDAGGKVFAIAR